MELTQSGHFNFSAAPLILPRTFGRIPRMADNESDTTDEECLGMLLQLHYELTFDRPK